MVGNNRKRNPYTTTAEIGRLECHLLVQLNEPRTEEQTKCIIQNYLARVLNNCLALYEAGKRDASPEVK